jgi:hypothetical protein
MIAPITPMAGPKKKFTILNTIIKITTMTIIANAFLIFVLI